MDAPRCPRCNAVFTPDEVRSAQPSVDCKFCKTRVLLKPPPVKPTLPVQAPLALPEAFVVTEHEAPTAITVTDSGDPYRSAPAPSVRPGLTITWRPPRPSLVAMTVFIVMWWVTLFVVQGAQGFPPIMIVLFALATTGMLALGLLRSTWMRTAHVHADQTALSVRTSPLRRASVLPAGDVVQLFTVHEPHRGQYGTYSSYVLHARDRRGRDHKIASLDTPEQAWWLEERLERHLGIEDRRIEGEHRLPLLTDGQPGDAGTTQT